MKTIDGESHFCEVFLDGARVPVPRSSGGGERRVERHPTSPSASSRTSPSRSTSSRCARSSSAWSLCPAPPSTTPGSCTTSAGSTAHRCPLAHDPALRHRGRGVRRAVAARLGGEARLQRARPGARPARHGAARSARPSAPTGPGPPRPRSCTTTCGRSRPRSPRAPPDPAQPHRRAHPRHAEGRVMVLDGVRVLRLRAVHHHARGAAPSSPTSAPTWSGSRSARAGEDRWVQAVTAGGEGGTFLQCNRNKRSLTLDSTTPAGAEITRRSSPAPTS